jgi:hypothetical protein
VIETASPSEVAKTTTRDGSFQKLALIPTFEKKKIPKGKKTTEDRAKAGEPPAKKLKGMSNVVDKVGLVIESLLIEMNKITRVRGTIT